MLSIPQRIRDAMTQPGTGGAVKVGIQPYGHPAASDFVSLEPFNWKPTAAITDLYCPVQACSPSDGSLVVLDADIKLGKVYKAPVVNGAIQYIKVTNGGSGYTSNPTVTVADNVTSVATAHANLAGGVVTSIVIDSGGSGYTREPKITLEYTAAGECTAPSAIAHLTNGVVTSIEILSGGSGLATCLVHVGGWGCVAYPIVSAGVVTKIIVPNNDSWFGPAGGWGYESYPLPVVTISGGGGSNAAAEVSDPETNYTYTTDVLDDCYFVESTGTISVEIQITTAGAQDKFKWREGYAGAWSAEVNCALADTTLTLSDARYIKIKFSAITGHTAGTTWYAVYGKDLYSPTQYGFRGSYMFWRPNSSTSPAEYVRFTSVKGLDDITITGTPTKAVNVTYTFTITTVGATDKFKWLKNGDTGDATEGVLSAEIDCSSTPIVIDGQVSVSWAATTGHHLNDYWTTRIVPDYGNYTIRRYVDSGSGEYNPTQTPSIAVTITDANARELGAGSFTVYWQGSGGTVHDTIEQILRHTIAIASNPNSAEVIIAAWITAANVNYLKVKLSTDYGVTFGEWVTIYSHDTEAMVEGNIAIGMNDAGNVGVFSNLGYYLKDGTDANNGVSVVRTSGSWVTGSELAVTSTDKQVAYDATFGWYFFTASNLINFEGAEQAVDTTPSTVTTNELQSFIEARNRNYNYIDPERVRREAIYQQYIIQTANPVYQIMIPQIGMGISFEQREIQPAFTEYIQQTQATATIPSTGWWVQLSENLFVVLNSYYCYLITKDGIDKITVSNHYYFNTVMASILAFSNDRIFQIRDHYIYYSNLPTEWSPPTAGTGAGAEIEFTNGTTGRLLYCAPYISEKQGSCYIVLNNYDGYFNTLSGDLAAIAKGSKVNVSWGYTIDGTAETMKNHSFFVESYGYTRRDNLPLFWIQCYDANWLLANYRFNRPVEWNEVIEAGVANKEYTIYEILGLIAQAIGGTISYRSRSTAMTTLYPHIKINAGDTAFQHWCNLLGMTSDKVVWDGNDPCIVYPQTTDTPNENYLFPQELVKVGGLNKFAFNAANLNVTQGEYYLTMFNPNFPSAPLRVNRVFVTGIDENNLTVTGEATDSESPENLLIINNVTIADGTTANNVAIAILSTARLSENRGGFMSNVQPALEQWDVITVVDTACNQYSNLRITGLQPFYQSALLGTYRFDQTLQLTSV